MNTLLISPRIAVQKGDFLGSGIPYWPIELAILAAYLRDCGNQVRVWDSLGAAPACFEQAGDHFMQGRSIDEWIQLANGISADAAIIYAMSFMSHEDIRYIIRRLRAGGYAGPVAVLENSQAVTAYALPHASESLFAAGADLLICGEAYWNWDEIEAALISGGVPPKNCLSCRHPAAEGGVQRLVSGAGARYPVPAWDLFSVEGYWRLPYAHGPKTGKFLPILTSRGCPYPCDFCVVPETNRRKWRARAVADVVAEMIELKQRTGVSDFQIEDLNPTVNSARWKELSEQLLAKSAGIRYYIVSGTKAETLRLEDILLYARSGCRYISISPESGSKAVMGSIGKPFDYDHGLKVIELCHEHGIRTQACFIVGHPSESDADHRLSLAYLRRLVRAGLDEAAIFIVAPIAGSRLQREARIEVADKDALLSFTPKGRSDWNILARRRAQLIRVFFIAKLRQGAGIWLQLFRALAGRPETKMENLFRRILFVLWHAYRPGLRHTHE
ncbi:MAG: B12-binding domain-containing radical SAM protein [Opitutae bacterium]|nr:B12-binding domain-containing radical SAM protein [Opitutae bacterium]